MTDLTHTAFESFLVEDVILTLGNLRGSLDWLSAGPEQNRVGRERLDRQLGHLEDRARAVCRELRSERAVDPVGAEPANLFADDFAPYMPQRAKVGPRAAGIPIGTAILDTLGDGERHADSAVFRSRRA
ncbi:hypothetical protein [Defluviimonas sp. SAOS-178_SWC]|uniref:hypothetical protein n=1 Tax=Defluviimonas sp. SAOS-178_SWC TaxID=3121287 RepID=UPI003221A924